MLPKVGPLQHATKSRSITKLIQESKHYKVLQNHTLIQSFSHFVNNQGNIILKALISLLEEGYTSNNKNITHKQIHAN